MLPVSARSNRDNVYYGLQASGYTAADIPQMVAGALQQQRLTKLSPRPCDEVNLAELFAESMRYW